MTMCWRIALALALAVSAETAAAQSIVISSDDPDNPPHLSKVTETR